MTDPFAIVPDHIGPDPEPVALHQPGDPVWLTKLLDQALDLEDAPDLPGDTKPCRDCGAPVPVERVRALCNEDIARRRASLFEDIKHALLLAEIKDTSRQLAAVDL